MLQHIHSKWVSSQIARGDPTLYPYDQSRHPSGPKWTPNSCITMRDVYVAIGAPSLFRLRFASVYIIYLSTQLYKYSRVLLVIVLFRYGWSSETCDKTDEPPSPSTPGITCFPNIEPENIFSNKRESASFTGKQMFEYSSEHTPPDGQVESTAVCLVKVFLFFSCFWTQILYHGIQS